MSDKFHFPRAAFPAGQPEDHVEAFNPCDKCYPNFPCGGDRSVCQRGFALPPHDAEPPPILEQMIAHGQSLLAQAERFAELERRTRPAPAVTLDEALAVLRDLVVADLYSPSRSTREDRIFDIVRRTQELLDRADAK